MKAARIVLVVIGILGALSAPFVRAQVIGVQPLAQAVYCWDTISQAWVANPNTSPAAPYSFGPQPIALYGYNAGLGQFTPQLASGGICPGFGTSIIGAGAPSGACAIEGQFYTDSAATPPDLYQCLGHIWKRVGSGSGTVNPGSGYALPAYGNGSSSTLGPSNLKTDATGNNLTVPDLIQPQTTVEIASVTPGSGYFGGCTVNLSGGTCSVQPSFDCFESSIVITGIEVRQRSAGDCSVAPSASISGPGGVGGALTLKLADTTLYADQAGTILPNGGRNGGGAAVGTYSPEILAPSIADEVTEGGKNVDCGGVITSWLHNAGSWLGLTGGCGYLALGPTNQVVFPDFSTGFPVAITNIAGTDSGLGFNAQERGAGPVWATPMGIDFSITGNGALALYGGGPGGGYSGTPVCTLVGGAHGAGTATTCSASIYSDPGPPIVTNGIQVTLSPGSASYTWAPTISVTGISGGVGFYPSVLRITGSSVHTGSAWMDPGGTFHVGSTAIGDASGDYARFGSAGVVIPSVGTSASTSPVCPNGTNGELTTSGCSGGGGGVPLLKGYTNPTLNYQFNAGGWSAANGLLCYGDSITAGDGLPPGAKAWCDILASDLNTGAVAYGHVGSSTQSSLSGELAEFGSGAAGLHLSDTDSPVVVEAYGMNNALYYGTTSADVIYTQQTYGATLLWAASVPRESLFTTAAPITTVATGCGSGTVTFTLSSSFYQNWNLLADTWSDVGYTYTASGFGTNTGFNGQTFTITTLPYWTSRTTTAIDFPYSGSCAAAGSETGTLTFNPWTTSGTASTNSTLFTDVPFTELSGIGSYEQESILPVGASGTLFVWYVGYGTGGGTGTVSVGGTPLVDQITGSSTLSAVQGEHNGFDTPDTIYLAIFTGLAANSVPTVQITSTGTGKFGVLRMVSQQGSVTGQGPKVGVFGVNREGGDADSAATAFYDTAIKNFVVTLSQTYGFSNIVPIDQRSWMNTDGDYNGGVGSCAGSATPVHPGCGGQTHMADAANNALAVASQSSNTKFYTAYLYADMLLPSTSLPAYVDIHGFNLTIAGPGDWSNRTLWVFNSGSTSANVNAFGGGSGGALFAIPPQCGSTFYLEPSVLDQTGYWCTGGSMTFVGVTAGKFLGTAWNATNNGSPAFYAWAAGSDVTQWGTNGTRHLVPGFGCNISTTYYGDANCFEEHQDGSSTSVYALDSQGFPHYNSGAPSSVSAGSFATGSTSQSGEVTGLSGASSVTINFNTWSGHFGWQTATFCTGNTDVAGTGVHPTAVSTAAVTFTFDASYTGDLFYSCGGY